KKAYQLGIKEIIYIDPYPGIAQEHILNIGKEKPTLIQFRGAIGRTYHRLYEQVLPLKDEYDYLIN
ncbi:deoxycytidylate deaminase, partial [Escherichia coli]|nr:deoxycytidylate deaminase [Escherichia coli]